MNKQFAKLAQSACLKEEIWHYLNGDPLICYTASDAAPEKFAKLVVRECANLIEVNYGQSEVSSNEVAKVLYDHFRVDSN